MKVIVILFVCVFVMTTPLFAGQLVSNEGINLRRELAGLYNVLIVGKITCMGSLSKTPLNCYLRVTRSFLTSPPSASISNSPVSFHCWTTAYSG